MNIQKYIKEIFITLLVISLTTIGYAAVTTVATGDSLSADTWNTLVGLVNQNETNLGNIGTDINNIDSRVTTNETNIGINSSRIDGIAGTSGLIVDYKYAQTNVASNFTATFPWDDTIPQITEGNLLLSLNITPKKTNNLLLFEGTINWNEPSNTANYFTAGLFKVGTSNAIATFVDGASNGTARCAASGYTQICTLPIRFTYMPNSTANQSFQLRVGLDNGSVNINQANNVRRLGGSLYSTFSVSEISQ